MPWLLVAVKHYRGGKTMLLILIFFFFLNTFKFKTNRHDVSCDVAKNIVDGNNVAKIIVVSNKII